MNKQLRLVLVGLIALVVATTGSNAEGEDEDLFADAGHSMSRSRWITIRTFPVIEIALSTDDVVLVQSAQHHPKGLALKIDGEAVAGDCELTDRKNRSTSYSVGQEKKKDEDKKVTTNTTSTVTTTTYYSTCRLDEGTTRRAVEADQITVQLAMDDKTTKAHELKPKAMAKFQVLDK